MALIVVVSICSKIVAQNHLGPKSLNWLNQYNVVWHSQSKNSSESMPCGGGDLGMNVWVENGDLLFYIDRSGNIDENDQLLKNGRVRIRMEPSPFSQNGDAALFEQKLDLKTGAVFIKGKTAENTGTIKVWAEIANPVIHVDLDSHEASKITATFECWRNEKQLIAPSHSAPQSIKMSRWACYGYSSHSGAVYSYPDVISHKNENQVVFYHQNGDDRIFDKSLKLQRLDGVKDQFYHPTKNRIFGGVMCGANLEKTENTSGEYANTPYKGWQLQSVKAAKKHRLEITLHTEQNESQVAWENHLNKKLSRVAQNAWHENLVWWATFWNRSHIVINNGKDASDLGWRVGRNYQLMRYMLGCNPNGEFPSHFNGGFFVFDPVYMEDEKGMHPSFYNADYRKWGAWTGMNQRLIHWSFLKSGDFEALRPQFNYYKRNLINAQLRNEVSFGIKGCSFGEQIDSGGLPIGDAYGWEPPYGKRNPKSEAGMQNKHRHYFHSQLEFAYMMHEWHRFTGADISEYIPFMKDVIVFYFEYNKMLQRRRDGNDWGADGKLVLKQTTATESYKNGDDPAPVIVALNKNIEALLELPDKWLSHAEKEKFKGWQKRIPDLHYRTRNGFKTINPLVGDDVRSGNREIPQLYPVFPYGLFCVGSPDLEIGVNTWKYGLDKATAQYIIDMYGDPDVYPQKEEWWGWGQQAIFLARLGLRDEAKEYVSKKMDDAKGDPWKNTKVARFPVFYGPGYGCMPDLEWGTSGMIALQEMCLQTISNNGHDLRVLPAWPNDWDVDFKLHAPEKTTVEVVAKNGKVGKVLVHPKARKKDILCSTHIAFRFFYSSFFPFSSSKI